MSEIVIKTDVLAPEREFVASYKCHHPARLLGVMLELMKQVWRISSSATYWDKVKWDRTGEVAEFFGEWRARDKKDRYSRVINRIVIEGKQAKDKSGEMRIRIKGTLFTTVPYKTIFDKILLKVYLDTIYRRQILQYIDLAQRRIKEFDREIRKMFELPESEVPHK